MSKKVNVKTITVTTNHAPANYMPINHKMEPGAEEFYKQNGITVRTMDKFGKQRTYAILPIDGYDEASEEEKVALAAQADAFNQAIDNKRRSEDRVNGRIKKHENISLDGLFETGYDPTLDKVDIAIKISEEETTSDDDMSNSDILLQKESMSYTDDFDSANKKKVSRGGYDSSADINNPEYIVAKNMVYAKLHAIIDELSGEDLAIVTAIMEDVSERALARQLGIPDTTLQRHRKKLLNRLRAILGEDANF